MAKNSKSWKKFKNMLFYGWKKFNFHYKTGWRKIKARGLPLAFLLYSIYKISFISSKDNTLGFIAAIQVAFVPKKVLSVVSKTTTGKR